MQKMCMQETLLGIRYFEKKSKILKIKKLTLFFLSNPVLFNGQDYEKQKWHGGTSDQSFFRLQSKFRQIPLLVMHDLTKFDDVIYISANLCNPIMTA